MIFWETSLRGRSDEITLRLSSNCLAMCRSVITAAVAGPSFKVKSPPYSFDHSVSLSSFVSACHV